MLFDKQLKSFIAPMTWVDIDYDNPRILAGLHRYITSFLSEHSFDLGNVGCRVIKSMRGSRMLPRATTGGLTASTSAAQVDRMERTNQKSAIFGERDSGRYYPFRIRTFRCILILRDAGVRLIFFLAVARVGIAGGRLFLSPMNASLCP